MSRPPGTPGIHLARAPVVAVLNSDCLVEPGWDEALYEAATTGRRIAFPYTDHCDGEGFRQPDQAGTAGWCFMLTRELYEEIGPFDEWFNPAYGEDTDYWHRAWELGVELSPGPGRARHARAAQLGPRGRARRVLLLGHRYKYGWKHGVDPLQAPPYYNREIVEYHCTHQPMPDADHVTGPPPPPSRLYPFWNTVVEPVLTAAGAERVVEIGALRGETTVRLLDLLGPQSELHVIDPLPIFDPEEHSRRFPGRYIFHRDISHNVLPDLPAVDAALVDGDHNWFTVYHELRFLREAAEAAGRPMPLLVMHDVGWPYGRRDLYYEPDRIPDEYRQPYARRALLPGRRDLSDRGGMNPHLANAVEEGGPRNGVMTALDDFVAEYDGSLRVVLLPLYFGLAIVAAEELLTARPQLARSARPARERRGPLRADRARRVDPDRRAGAVPQPRTTGPHPQLEGHGLALPRPGQGALSWTSTISRTRCASST